MNDKRNILVLFVLVMIMGFLTGCIAPAFNYVSYQDRSKVCYKNIERNNIPSENVKEHWMCCMYGLAYSGFEDKGYKKCIRLMEKEN